VKSQPFRAFSRAGQSLAGLHLDHEKPDPWELKWIETPEVPPSYTVTLLDLFAEGEAFYTFIKGSVIEWTF
jgi:predicted helicase